MSGVPLWDEERVNALLVVVVLAGFGSMVLLFGAITTDVLWQRVFFGVLWAALFIATLRAFLRLIRT